jgi:hypothetical protein
MAGVVVAATEPKIRSQPPAAIDPVLRVAPVVLQHSCRVSHPINHGDIPRWLRHLDAEAFLEDGISSIAHKELCTKRNPYKTLARLSAELSSR